MTPSQFVVVLESTESDSQAKQWGDDGRAVGAYQAHIDWIFTYALRYKCFPNVKERFNDFVCRLILLFFAEYSPKFTDTEVAMHYHEGHEVLAQNVDWDEEYASRFRDKAQKLGIAAT